MGIVGAGLMGRWHGRMAERAGARVVSVADPNPDATLRLATRHGGSRVFASADEMLEGVEIDVLHVCTPPATHCYIAERAIEAGINLVIEKPFTPTASEAEQLFDKAGARGIAICPVHQFLFQDGVTKARRSLERIGRLIHVEGTVCSAGGAGRSGEQLESIAAEILPHPLSMMQMFLPDGLPEEGWITLRPTPGELRAFSRKSDITLTILISMRARPTACNFKLVGTEGTVHLDMFHGFSFIERGRVSRFSKIARPFDLGMKQFLGAGANLLHRAMRRELAYPGLQTLITSFYEAIANGTPPPISRPDTIRVAMVRDRLMDYAVLNNTFTLKGRAECL